MKKILVATLTALSLISVLSACGQGSPMPTYGKLEFSQIEEINVDALATGVKIKMRKPEPDNLKWPIATATIANGQVSISMAADAVTSDLPEGILRTDYMNGEITIGVTDATTQQWSPLATMYAPVETDGSWSISVPLPTKTTKVNYFIHLKKPAGGEVSFKARLKMVIQKDYKVDKFADGFAITMPAPSPSASGSPMPVPQPTPVS